MNKKIIFVSILGTSPSVLTETIWALAHLPAPVIPDEIITITTLRGRDALQRLLFGEDGGWSRFKAALAGEGIPVAGKLRFGDTQSNIRILSDSAGEKDLADIATSADNARAADEILAILRGYTEDPSTQVYASIAGGRKTMSALLFSCMSLLGRAGDHVLHVLVNTPFDGGVEPTFFFPEQGVVYKSRTDEKKTYSAEDARIELIDLPFVKMRGWYQDKFCSSPPSYGELVAAVQDVAPEADVAPPLLKFDMDRGRVYADDVDLALSPPEFVAFAVSILAPVRDLPRALHLLHDSTRGVANVPWLYDFMASPRFAHCTPDDAPAELSRILNCLRMKLRKVKGLVPYIGTLVPRGYRCGTYPSNRISAEVEKFRRLIGLPASKPEKIQRPKNGK